jgi:ribosomal protein L37AE/L43A
MILSLIIITSAIIVSVLFSVKKRHNQYCDKCNVKATRIIGNIYACPKCHDNWVNLKLDKK